MTSSWAERMDHVFDPARRREIRADRRERARRTRVPRRRLILAAVVLHFVFRGGRGEHRLLAHAGGGPVRRHEAVSRVGVAIYLLAITLGLATIVQVAPFQSIRIRELAANAFGADTT